MRAFRDWLALNLLAWLNLLAGLAGLALALSLFALALVVANVALDVYRDLQGIDANDD